jgi:hypothetical protein
MRGRGPFRFLSRVEDVSLSQQHQLLLEETHALSPQYTHVIVESMKSNEYSIISNKSSNDIRSETRRRHEIIHYSTTGCAAKRAPDEVLLLEPFVPEPYHFTWKELHVVEQCLT